jgi:hypothetical protein
MKYVKILILAAAVIAAGLAATSEREAFDPEDLQGTWQIMSIKNLKTGEVDEIAKRRTIWFQVTKTHWTYIWMDLDRKVVTPEELAKLPEEARVKTNYTKIWNQEHEPRFWASGGTYKIEDGNFVYIDLLSIEPHMIDTDGVEKIVRLDDTTYVYHSRPRNGVVSEYTHRRLSR